MYESYWNLQGKPFVNCVDTSFYYPSSEHHAALLKLRYAVEGGSSAALLTGTSGVGKTLLLHCLAQQLSERCHPVAHIVFPQLAPDQLLGYLADKLVGPSEGDLPTFRAVQRLEKFLEENAATGRQAVLFFDEGHLLQENASLEVLRLLMNFQYEGRPALSIVVAGLPGLLGTLERMPELEERFAVKCLLPALAEEDTRHYVEHRLGVAGVSESIFDASAIRALHHHAHGSPRRINRLADLALLIAYAEERTSIEAAQIEAVAEELAPLAVG
jgi:type II secretory pathway predicted ATPase ExeA